MKQTKYVRIWNDSAENNSLTVYVGARTLTHYKNWKGNKWIRPVATDSRNINESGSSGP